MRRSEWVKPSWRQNIGHVIDRWRVILLLRERRHRVEGLMRLQRGASRRRVGQRIPLFLEPLEPRVLLTAATPLGVHIEANKDWSRSFMFVDAMKSCRQFGSASAPWDGSAPVDADGWPTTDFGAVVITLIAPPLAIQDF